MKMLDAKLVFMLELLNLLERSFFIVLLVLCGRLDARLQFLANEQDLTILIVKILRLCFNPS